MRTQNRLFAMALVAAAIVALQPEPAGAIPVFARKYGFACTNCHSAFPRLNDWGQQFRDNGYQIPGLERQERTVLEGPAPFAMRTNVGFLRESLSHSDFAFHREGLKVAGLDFLSAGVIGRHAAYELAILPQLAASRGVEEQEGSLESASVIFRSIADSPWLNLRVGRFEPAYVAFSVKRQLSIVQREVYAYGPPALGFTFAEKQDGVEVSGYGRRLSYAAGLVDGSPANFEDDKPMDVYGRVVMAFGPGKGQTAGQRIGVSGYYGQGRAALNDTTISRHEHFTRLGIDASLNYATLNLAAQYLLARDSRWLWVGSLENKDWSGWFAELIWQPRVDCALFGRWDAIQAPDGYDDLAAWTVGARYYLASNLALHAEFSQRTEDTGGETDPKFETTAIRCDFAF